MPEVPSGPDLLALTGDIVMAFVSNNVIKPEDLPQLIADTHSALASAAAGGSGEPAAPEFTAAVSVRKSLARPDVIISMIDGKPYKTLKRHLSARGLTADQYRARYNLPRTYPMVAPAYSELRREAAKRIGLTGKAAAARRAAVGNSAGPGGKAARRA